MLSRRAALEALGASALTLAWPGAAQAGLARVVTLAELVKASAHVLQGVPLDVVSRWESVGNQRRIVSYTRVRAEELIAGVSPADSELMVRTLGGQVGDVGQVVSGEASLGLNEPCLVFLRQIPDGLEQVVAMAQGHYPIQQAPDGVRRLLSSPNLPHMLGNQPSAVRALVGLRLDEAKQQIQRLR